VPPLDIPTRVDELTPEWLTHALREGGLLGEAKVSSVRHETLSEGKGFIGQVFRLHLGLEPAESGAPHTLIAKLPTTVRENRAVGELLGAYEREILFYRELADLVPIRTPRAFFSQMEGSRTSKREAEGAAMMDRLPMWLIRAGMRFVTWISARRERDYVLLIEDLAPDLPGDQVAGCSPDRARDTLESIAAVHARFWCSESLQQSYWLRRLDLNPRTMHSVFLQNVPEFRERFASHSTDLNRSLAWLEQNAVELMRALHASAPETLLHCDLRLDNVTFPPDGEPSDDRIGLFDWQLCGRGPGVYDVAYFLSGALAVDAPTETARELVEAYHGALCAHAVEDYALEECLRDYHRGLLCVLHRVASTDTMEFGDERGAELIAVWMERNLARLRGVDFDALLSEPGR
jgi:thiamine kinase-like enzyme